MNTCTIFASANLTWHQLHLYGKGQALRWNVVHSLFLSVQTFSAFHPSHRQHLIQDTVSGSKHLSEGDKSTGFSQLSKPSFPHRAEMLSRVRKVSKFAFRHENIRGKSSSTSSKEKMLSLANSERSKKSHTELLRKEISFTTCPSPFHRALSAQFPAVLGKHEECRTTQGSRSITASSLITHTTLLLQELLSSREASSTPN